MPLPSNTHRHLHPDSPWLLGLLALVVALGPLSVDMYLPAMPAMREALDTTVSGIQLTLSAYLTGFAVFHLVCGPLADRYGRRPILLGGTVIFVAACLGCSLAGSVEELVVYRFLQGVGACVGPTLGRAITRDIFGPKRAARALSIIAMLMALAPAIAPGLGSVMMLALPWPSIFVFLALYGALAVFLLWRYLPESLPEVQSLHLGVIARNYSHLLSQGAFMSVVVGSSLMYAAMIAYLASSGFVYLEMLGLPLQYFGFVFVSTVAGYFLGSAGSARLSQHFDSPRLMLMGAIMTSVACLIMLAWSSWQPQSVLPLALPVMLFTAGMGLVLPHAMNLALQPYPQMVGTASALLGFIQMGVSAGASALTGVLLKDSPAPLVWLMVGLSISGLLLLLYRGRRLQVDH